MKYEYTVFLIPDIDTTELNELAADGWVVDSVISMQTDTTYPTVLLRREFAEPTPKLFCGTADDWNARHPIGTRVIVRLFGGVPLETVTTSEARTAINGWVLDVQGCEFPVSLATVEVMK